MLPIAYTKNEELHAKIDTLEDLRRDLHVTPINKREFYGLRWDATLSRIDGMLKLDGNAMNKGEIYKILKDQKNTYPIAQKILTYKKALDYIGNEWYVTEEKISPNTIATLDAFVTGNIKSTLSKRTPIESLYDIKQLFNYLQSGNEHPVIQAGMVYVEIIHKELIPVTSHKLATLLAYTFLYKYGWDFRELLTLERAWLDTKNDYDHALLVTKDNNNATVWLHYFVDLLVNQITEIITMLSLRESTRLHRSLHLQLSVRHNNIISQLDDPKSRITNNQVQKLFGVSQITASRDLAQLTRMGLLFSHSKGRSTYYTRV